MRPRSITPSTDQTAYLTPVRSDVSFVPLLSAGDTVPGASTTSGTPWRFVGIPDGIGAYDNHDGTITVLVNHELDADQGGARDTGAQSGAFVDRLVIDKSSLRVTDAGELGKHLYLFDPASGSYLGQPTAL